MRIIFKEIYLHYTSGIIMYYYSLSKWIWLYGVEVTLLPALTPKLKHHY